ncbi:MAG: alpha-amylase family protein, partial [Halanaerobiales bacterium]
EIDPIRYESNWWKNYWNATEIQGIIVNANGIVAYYPTRFDKIHKAKYLKNRDLFGKIIKDAREEGLVVLARMDSNRVHNDFYLEHPNWTARDKFGNPYKAGDLYIQCINSPYYREFLPNVLKEIVEKYSPEGITDNSWNGLNRNKICYCQYCKAKFKEDTGFTNLPEEKNWNKTRYRKWIEWSYNKRIEIWELNNKVTKQVGGDNCLWIGMIGGEVISQSKKFRNIKAIGERAKILMLDMQTRGATDSFHINKEAGKLLHNILGWDKLIPESMAMYQAGKPTFRIASKPKVEARLWALEGFSGSIQPWWHHVGAYQEDRRQFETAPDLFKWHKKNEKYLINREPIATVGLVWSQRNTDFYGREKAQILTHLPWKGFSRVLTRYRIPYLPVNIDKIDELQNQLEVIIFPNIGIMNEEQAELIRKFIKNGGAIIATGETGLYDKWGEQREDFLLSDLFQAHSCKTSLGSYSGETSSWDDWRFHSYLRLKPEIRKKIRGPHIENEPEISRERSEVLRGFDKTDILPFGGNLHVVEAGKNAQIIANFMPQFPIYPPEKSWVRKSATDLPGLILNKFLPKGKVVYLSADIDRCYGRVNLPDHGQLLKNIIHWAAGENIPIKVEGEGLIDCELYRKNNVLIIHLINLTNSEAWRTTVHDFVSIGPIEITLKLPEKKSKIDVITKVKKNNIILIGKKNKEIRLKVKSIKDHEMIIIK